MILSLVLIDSFSVVYCFLIVARAVAYIVDVALLALKQAVTVI
jgi:hypothetical protein